MLQAALHAFTTLMDPVHMGLLLVGVCVGLILGATPGLGGVIGLAILLPFTYGMQASSAMAMMMGLLSVICTADTIPSVLFGVPGTSAAQATVMDGFPMAKRGEAGRALGAAYMSSLMGGIFGAIVLVASIPILRPLVLAMGAPEFFMMGMVGLSMVVVLSGRSLAKGLVVVAVGLLLGTVGMDPQVGYLRWTFGQLYLLNGIPLVPVVVGIFGIPEIIDLLIKNTRISEVAARLGGTTQGIRDALRNWWLVARCSAIGVWVGAVPGLGSSVVDWFAYGYAYNTVKDARTTFGKGNVLGVIAPESANNAKEGGALIPTLAFGVPGSATMAMLLGAFQIHGITPGKDLLTSRLDMVFVLVFSLVIANIFGAGICLLLTNQIAKIVNIRMSLLAPIVMAVTAMAAYTATRHYGDLIVLVLISAAGWLMKRFGWPRPPLILGFVLCRMLEGYLFVSIQRYGSAWLLRPAVVAMGILIIAFVVYNLVARKPLSEPSPPAQA